MGRQDNYIFSDVNAMSISRDVYYFYEHWSKERKEELWKQFSIENNMMF